MSLYNLVIPLGITTIALMLITALLGLRSKILAAKLRLRIHKLAAVITILLALFHGSIVFYYNFLQ